MRILFAGQERLFEEDHWTETLRRYRKHTGNAMLRSDVIEFNKSISVDGL